MATNYYYEDLTDIMAAPYNGQVVSAAYCMQVRDNLMALRRGESFKLQQTAAQTTGTTFLWPSVVWTTPGVDTSTAATDGYVKIPTGIWLIGCDAQAAPVGYRSISGSALGDIKETQTGAMCGMVFVTGPTPGVRVTTDGTTISTSVAAYNPYLWGVWLRDLD